MSKIALSDVSRVVHPYHKNYEYFKELCDACGIQAPPVIADSDGIRFVLNNCHTELANAIRTFMEYFVEIKCMSCSQVDILTDDPYIRQLKYGHFVSRLTLVPILQTVNWEKAEISLPPVKNTTDSIQPIYMSSFEIKGVKSARPLVPLDGMFAYLNPGYTLEIKNIKIVSGFVAKSAAGAAHSMTGRVSMEVLDQKEESCMNSTPMMYALTIPPQRYGSVEHIIHSAFESMQTKLSNLLKLSKAYKQNIFTEQVDFIGYETKFTALLKEETLAFGNLLCRYIYNTDPSIERCYCEEMDNFSLGIILTIIHVDAVALLAKAISNLMLDVEAIHRQLKANIV
jgi:hypothetical protein